MSKPVRLSFSEMKTLHWITFALKKQKNNKTKFRVAWVTFALNNVCTSSKQKQKKTKFRVAGTEVRYIFRIFSMAFRNTLLEQIVEMPDLSGHWLYNFNTLRDKNESVTETNKIGSTQITAPSPTPLTPCTSTIKDIETLINKTCQFSGTNFVLSTKMHWKKISLGEHSKRNNLEGRYFKNSNKTLQTYFWRVTVHIVI